MIHVSAFTFAFGTMPIRFVALGDERPKRAYRLTAQGSMYCHRPLGSIVQPSTPS